MSDELQAEANAVEAPASTGPGKVVLIGAVAGTLLVGAAAGLLVIGPKVAGARAPAADSTHAEGAAADDHAGGAKPAGAAVHTIDNMVLNPAQSNGSRFLLVATAVEVSEPGLVDQLKTRDAEARDVLINVMGRRTVEQLTDLAQRDSLRAEIAAALNEMLRKPKGVRRVYFSQFVVQ